MDVNKKIKFDQLSIEDTDESTILSYIENMNSLRFQEVANLFVENGALKPPFHKAIMGKKEIFTYLQKECVDIMLLPHTVEILMKQEGLTPVIVIGEVQVSVFGQNINIKVEWQFVLDVKSQIVSASINVLTPPQELLNLGLAR